MANLPQQDTIKQYLADGVTIVYEAPFFVPLSDDPEPDTPAIDVYVTLQGEPPIPESDIKIFNVDYTFTENLDPITGGTVNFITGHLPPASAIVTLVRNVPASLDVEFSNAQNFSGANLDEALDKLLLIEQQNKTYCLQRNLSYIVNSYLPDNVLLSNTQIPILAENEIWMGLNGGVGAVVLEQNPDVSTLRSELANQQPVTNGAHLVGYYDPINLTSQTVKDFLDDLPTYINGVTQTQYYNDSGSVNAIEITVPNYSAYSVGDRFFVLVGHTNTISPPTFNVNSIGAIQIDVGTALQAYPFDLQGGTFALLEYNGFGWVLLNPLSMLQKISYAASVFLSNNQSIPNNMSIYTLINFETVAFDPYSLWNNTSKVFTAPITGYYKATANVILTAGDDTTTWTGAIFVNGSIVRNIVTGNYSSSGTPDAGANGSTILNLAFGDTVDFRMSQGGGVSTLLRGSSSNTYFQLEYIGR